MKASRSMLAPVGTLLAVCVPLSAGANVTGAGGAAHNGTRTFQGAWFSIKYPACFSVGKSQRSASGPGYDGAVFTAPDGAVQFYVFSPQWNGNPAYCRLDSRREVMVDRHTQRIVNAGRTTTANFETVRACDGSYGRSWVDTTTSLNTRLVFGVRYRDARSLSAYQSQYLRFKKSLKQFAD